MRTIEVIPSGRIAAIAARRIVGAVSAAVRSRGVCHWVLSGGTTPRRIFEAIAGTHANEIEWRRVHFYWGDERAVSPDDPASNYRMASESLLGPLGIAEKNVHRIPGEHGAAAAAGYEAELRRLPWAADAPPRFDVVMLGMGADGHTASLFPGDGALCEVAAWTAPAHAPMKPHQRITMTFPVLNSARCVILIATGGDKADAFRRAIHEMGERPPAGRIDPHEGVLLCLVDEDCAGCISAGRCGQ